MSKKLKKILALLLAAMMLVTFCACDVEDDKDSSYDDGAGNGYNDDADDEEIDIDSVDLEEHQGITYDGIVFDQKLSLNGYEFYMRCDIDEFLEGTKTVLNDPQALEDFKNNSDALFEGLECYIQDGDNKVNFKITVGHTDEGGTVLREINIMSDYKYKDDDFLMYPNLITCGFTFFGCDIDKNQFMDLPKKMVNRAKKSGDLEDGDGELYIKTERGDYWNITISTSNTEENPNYYYFDYVIVSTIAY